LSRRAHVTARDLVAALRRLKLVFGVEAAAERRQLLRAVRRARCGTAGELLELHDLVLFARTYPDDAEIAELADATLAGFAARSDLRRHRRALVSSGVAGCDLSYPFFYATALRLAERHPDRLTIDWSGWEKKRDVESLLPLLVSYSESPLVDEFDLTPRGWLDRLRAEGEADGSFLVRRMARLAGDDLVRETLYDRLGPSLRLSGGPATPSRSAARAPVGRPIVYQREALDTRRPDLSRDLDAIPVGAREVPRGDARRLVELARDAMVTRSRDLDAFANADDRDVRLIDCDRGLSFACLGVVPERRLMLEAVYGLLTLQNGVPIGYVLLSSLHDSTEIAYNVFDLYRGAEAARVFARVVAVARALFGSATFSIDPYQLGHFGNEEGLASGAWWFYYKLGFRPRDETVKKLVRRELAAMRRRRGHRSSRATLERLSAEPLFLELGRGGGVALGGLSPGQVGGRITDALAARAGADRERALDDCERQAAERCGLRDRRGWSAGERLWWRRWSPLVTLLPGLERWSSAERRALVDVVRAKGGRREADYVRRFDAHPKLRRAVLRMMTPE